VGDTAYGHSGSGSRPPNWPTWLLRPQSPEGLAREWIGRGLFPGAVTLHWQDGGPAVVFGSRPGHAGRRLIVDRERGVPLVWKNLAGQTWRFRHYQWREGDQRRRLVPQRIVLEKPGEEGRRVFVAQ
jgi:hypothetical protein